MSAPAAVPTRTFAIEAAWQALVVLLATQLEGVNVDAIGSRDFDENGELTVVPPAVRVIFAGEKAQTFENQNQNYNAGQQFGAICADDYRGPDPQQQRVASLALARLATDVVTGARLRLPDGTVTEPIEYAGTTPMPVADIGVAYVVEWRIPGIAQFPAPNAAPGPYQPTQGGN